MVGRYCTTTTTYYICTCPSIVLLDPVLSSKAGYSVEEILFMIVLKIIVIKSWV